MTDARYFTPQWRRLTNVILERDKWTCQIRDRGCTHHATAVDHIEAVIEGGMFFDPENLRAACRHCNSVRGARLAAARASRYSDTNGRW